MNSFFDIMTSKINTDSSHVDPGTNEEEASLFTAMGDSDYDTTRKKSIKKIGWIGCIAVGCL